MDNDSIRAWPYLLDVRKRSLLLPGHRATLVIGSFAAGTADDLSDIDLYVLIDDGAFTDAWDHRDSLRPHGALYWWDIRPDANREIGTHNWLTSDMVLVECALTTAKAQPRLSEPYMVVEGDPAAVELVHPSGPDLAARTQRLQHPPRSRRAPTRGPPALRRLHPCPARRPNRTTLPSPNASGDIPEH